MLMLLPIAAFTLFFLVIWTSPSGEAALDWRKAFLQAAGLWGVVLVAITEGLSLGHALIAGWVGVGWAVAAVAAAAWAIRSGGIARRWARIPRSWLAPNWVSLVILVGMAGIVVCLLVVAWVSPPNNMDSLQYHMSRVTHWAQDASLQHYATAFDPQLINPIFAESATLNFRLLFGSDKPVNLVQWYSMIGCLIGVSAIAALLGASRRGQLVASAFALSIPMGLLQSSSTQNDYVVAFWLVGLAYYGLTASQRALTLSEWALAGSALGLGMLTKGTFYPYALPFTVWIVVAQIRCAGWGPALVRAAAMGVVVVLLNIGYWLRNTGTYGSPLGPLSWIQRTTSSNRSASTILAALTENTVLNFATPSEAVNVRIAKWIGLVSGRLGLAPHGFALTWSWNHEDLAGSPLHVILVPLTVVLLIATFRGRKNPPLLGYALCSLASFAMLAAVVTFDVYGLRYQLPFLIIWAPLVGVAVSRLGPNRLAALAAMVFLLLALPWVLFNRSRPLIGMRPNTMTGSILRVLPIDILFASGAAQGADYERAVAKVESLGCRTVGLRIDSHDPEYAFWWLLKAPQSGVKIEVLDPTPASQRYLDPAFKPCAIVCTICGDRARLHGMPLLSPYGSVRVFAGSGFTSDKDG